MSNVRTQIGKAIGKSLNSYHSRVKPKIDELKFKEQYQGRIIDCMVGEVDDNYIETPETDEKVVKLEHSKDGVVKIARIKGKTILVDEEGNETDTPGEGCRLVSVGEDEDNKLIILSKNEDNSLSHKTEISLKEPLRKIDDNVFDEIRDKYLIKRTCKGIIHNPRFTVYGSFERFENTVMLLVGRFKNMKISSKVISSQLETVHHWNVDKKSIFVDHDINIHIPKSELMTLDEEGIKQWLSENPLEVLYELVEPIIEELPNSITIQGFDDTTMYIENSIVPTVSYGYNALIPYKEELRTQKEEVETNALDIEQNIIPYLMDMEFNLMLMEDE